jgi:hypothetical protein
MMKKVAVVVVGERNQSTAFFSLKTIRNKDMPL